MKSQTHKPELMSPAGYWPELSAAIEGGADAVYFGLKHFSARAKVGFSLDELPDVMRTLHRRGVKGFVTFNTLVFDHEMQSAQEALVQIANAGVDAIIVQDVGVAQMARSIAPNLEIHGSTQMSVTSAEGIELAASFGCTRVVLGRELSLTDIRKIAGQTDIELEVFVHGALCVSYSGQCFSSEAWGGRSANRGKCAQACRLSYDLIVDGHQREMGSDRYLLSPGDLYAIEQIPELCDIGIACVKIEGRYKDADYVALTTRAYRKAIDDAVAEKSVVQSDEVRIDIEQIYSRGLGPHFMSGVNHQSVVDARAPRHRGVQIGKVVEVFLSHVVVKLSHEIHRGDGLVFDAADWRSPDDPEEGGNVYGVEPIDENHVRLEFGDNEIDFTRIRIGDLVWRTKDPRLPKKLKTITSATKPVFTRPIDFRVTAMVGHPLRIVAQTEQGESSTHVENDPIAVAQKRSLDSEMLHEQLGRLGGTPFHLRDIQFESDGKCFVPVSVLNAARRTLVESIIAERELLPDPVKFTSAAGLESDSVVDTIGTKESERTTRIHLLVRTAEQLDAAIECQPASITLDYLELYGLRPSVEKITAAGIVARVASPRILKPSEQKVVRFLLSLDCAILVRSGGLLHDLKTNFSEQLPDLIGDFSLNTANALTANTYLEMGLAKITPTYDLNSKQISELAGQIDPACMEVIAYSHLPVFHTEHCVFCRFLSDGTDNTNCGHPCEKHRVAIRDSQGREHPVMADVGCRNTVFGAEAQTDPTSLVSWREAGIKDLRIEFVHQSPDQINGIYGAFNKFCRGEQTEQQLTYYLKQYSPQETTLGSLYVSNDYKNLVQLH